jgi:hypothetical protein
MVQRGIVNILLALCGGSKCGRIKLVGSGCDLLVGESESNVATRDIWRLPLVSKV